MDTLCWCVKLNLALCCGDSAVSNREMQSIPGPTELTNLSRLHEANLNAGGYRGAPMNVATSPHLLVAMAAEKYGFDDLALQFCEEIHTVDHHLGGDPKPTSHILAHLVKGRILAQRGQTSAASTAFEAAAAQARALQLWLLEVLAVLDLKLFLLDDLGHGEHGARRLGAVLRLLQGPAELLTPMLKGLDAAELMGLAEPEADYTVVYEAQDAGMAALRQELQSMRVIALQKRAVEDGVDSDTIEDAMDSDNPKVQLTKLIVEAQQQITGQRGAQLQQLREELQGQRVMELQKRSVAAGIDNIILEDAMDSDNPRGSLIELLVSAAATSLASDSGTPLSGAAVGPCLSEGVPPQPVPKGCLDVQKGTSTFHSQLQELKLSALKRRAREAGVGKQALEEADDADNTKEVVIGLIMEIENPSSGQDYDDEGDLQARLTKLREELATQKLSQLKKRARSAKVSREALEQADDEHDIRETVIALILQQAEQRV
eukprot:COSAG05_NODE_315_length_11604_cov_8.336375_4_plen_489_part_00